MLGAGGGVQTCALLLGTSGVIIRNEASDEHEPFRREAQGVLSGPALLPRLRGSEAPIIVGVAGALDGVANPLRPESFDCFAVGVLQLNGSFEAFRVFGSATGVPGMLSSFDFDSIRSARGMFSEATAAGGSNARIGDTSFRLQRIRLCHGGGIGGLKTLK